MKHENSGVPGNHFSHDYIHNNAQSRVPYYRNPLITFECSGVYVLDSTINTIKLDLNLEDHVYPLFISSYRPALGSMVKHYRHDLL